MSVVRYCPYLATESFMRKMLQDYKPMADIAVGLLLWVMIIANVAWCARSAQASDAQRGAKELEAEEADDFDEEDVDGLQEHIDLLESQVKELREQNDILKGEVEVLKKRKAPRKVIGMKILGGFRAGAGVGRGSLEDNVQQALSDGWEISGAPMHAADTSASWYQTMLRYETEAVAEPKTEAVAEPKTEAVAEPKTEPIPRSVKTRAPPLSSPPTPDDPYMLKVEDVAEKIRALPKGVWKTSYEIQKALEPAPPHKTPFAPIQAINSVLYTMLGKGAVEKGVHPHDKRPIWKLV